MLNLADLEQFVMFAETGTLTRVAEETHISTPSVTRTMQRVEEAFGVPIFTRGKNSIALNETGELAAVRARALLAAAEQTVQEVQAYDRSRKTITVRSCAPAPLWRLQQSLQVQFPGMTIASSIGQNCDVIDAMKSGECDYAILPFRTNQELYDVEEYMKENLYVCVPEDHVLAGRTEVSSEDLNGFNFLLRSELGFWDALCRRALPASRFLVQTDEFEFMELVRSSSLPCFATDYTGTIGHVPAGRVVIPISDAAVHAVFYLYKKREQGRNTEV